MRTQLKKITLSGLFLALCLLLPFLTMQISQIGKALSPMHIPVFICGFVLGAPYGAAVGLAAPILRSLFFSAPMMFPDAVCMAPELAVYGLAAGILYKVLPKKLPYVYVSLVSSMLAGRAVWGAARYLVAGIGNTEFSFSAFLAGAFTNAVPGIVCHLIIVPIVVIALRRANMIYND